MTRTVRVDGLAALHVARADAARRRTSTSASDIWALGRDPVRARRRRAAVQRRDACRSWSCRSCPHRRLRSGTSDPDAPDGLDAVHPQVHGEGPRQALRVGRRARDRALAVRAEAIEDVGRAHLGRDARRRLLRERARAPPSSDNTTGEPVAGAGTAASWGRTTTGDGPERLARRRLAWGVLVMLGVTAMLVHKSAVADPPASASASAIPATSRRKRRTRARLRR